MTEWNTTRTSVVATGIGIVVALVVALRIDPHFFVIPDELATATIAKRVSLYQSISIVDPLISISEGLIHPRSMTTIGDRIVPEGFIALGYWYGLLMRVIPSSHLPFIISILSTLAASIALRYLFPLFFEDQNVLRFGAFVYPTLPPILYYTFHPYLANLLQWNMLLIVATGIIMPPHRAKGQFVWSLGVGVLYGIALSLRPIESIWIAPFTLLLIFWKRVHWSWPKLGVAATGMLIPLIVLGMVQHNVYGSWWATGYGLNPSLHLGVPSTHGIFLSVRTILFPFGVHLGTIWYRIKTIAIPLWWWAFILGAFGLRRQIFEKKTYYWWGATLLLSLWLLVFYGSWTVSEPEDTGVVALSTGFVRYALPLWALVLPLIVSGMTELSHLLPNSLRKIGMSLIIGCFILSPLVYSPTSIIKQKQEISTYPGRVAFVMNHTPVNAILITKRSDKVYFPYRRVVVWYKEPQKVAQILPVLLDNAPVYLVVEDTEGGQLTLPRSVQVENRLRISRNEELRKLIVRTTSALSYEQ